MSRRLSTAVEDDDEDARRQRFVRWRRPGSRRVPDPDVPHVGDPDGPRLVRTGVRAEDVTDADLVPGAGVWRGDPIMAGYHAFVRAERDRLCAEGVDPDERV